ncbi:hypothetical protein TcCL_NonESM04841 [Trypanosoma cruzi]|nr:hypothetical protein TcCL_NonESM04841 [Trypanosoma cruzi]
MAVVRSRISVERDSYGLVRHFHRQTHGSPCALATPGRPNQGKGSRPNTQPARRRSWKPGALLLLCRRFAPANCNASCMQIRGKAELQFITSTRRFAGSFLHCTK